MSELQLLTPEEVARLYPEYAAAVGNFTEMDTTGAGAHQTRTAEHNVEEGNNMVGATCATHVVDATRLLCDETLDRTDIECSERLEYVSAVMGPHRQGLEALKAVAALAKELEEMKNHAKTSTDAAPLGYCARCCAKLSLTDREVHARYQESQRDPVLLNIFALHDHPIQCPFCGALDIAAGQEPRGCSYTQEACDLMTRRLLFMSNEGQLIDRVSAASKRLHALL